MAEPKDLHYVNKQSIPVVIETIQNRIKGKIHVLYNHRPSDLLNSKEQFIAVTEATIYPLHDDKRIGERSFIAVNKQHIVTLHEQ
jgi:hypothetical protein